MPAKQKHFFPDVVELLDKYYPLVELVNNGKILLENDLEPYFPTELNEEIIHLQQLYDVSKMKRTCGNPSFIHSMRCLIWARALGYEKHTGRVTLLHDVVEDFGKNYKQMIKLLQKIPEDVRQQVNMLTNKYKSFLQELEEKGSQPKKLLRFLMKSSFDPALRPMQKRMQEEIISVGNEDVSFSHFKTERYKYYIDDILDFAIEHKDDSVVAAKLIDRLDNTLSELPNKFSTILKVFGKNSTLLAQTQNYVLKSNNESLQLTYLLLYERSLDQSAALRRRYVHIADVRGDFYGKQYHKLCNNLLEEENKLRLHESAANKLYTSKSLQKFVENLIK